jgi:21S rRNA (GM2251-2'-O)-methyltransferase
MHAGAGNEADAMSCRSFKPESPIILVVGNEGRGLRPVVRRACRDVLRIDSVAVKGNQFSPVGVESLNVSMAAGILLHQLLHPE